MRRIIALLSALILLAAAQPGVAQDKFLIYVHGPDGGMVSGATVTIYQDGSQIDSGMTDSSGVYTAWLSSGSNYRIKASYEGQKGRWEGTPDRSNGNRIDIYLS